METVISLTITNFLIIIGGCLLGGIKIGMDIQKAKK